MFCPKEKKVIVANNPVLITFFMYFECLMLLMSDLFPLSREREFRLLRLLQRAARANYKPGAMNCLQAHHLFEFYGLPAADFNFFAAFHFQQQSTIEIRFYFVNKAKVHNMFAVGAEKSFLVQPFFQRIQ